MLWSTKQVAVSSKQEQTKEQLTEPCSPRTHLACPILFAAQRASSSTSVMLGARPREERVTRAVSTTASSRGLSLCTRARTSCR